MGGPRGCEQTRGPESAQTFCVTPDEAARFRALVQKGDGCWLWLGRKGTGGYGSFSLSYRKGPTVAHRVAYAIEHGPIPRGMNVCHRCDNPPCVNPAHLFLASHRQNMGDMAAKGRHASAVPDMRCSRGHFYTSPNTLSNGKDGGPLNRQCVLCRLVANQEQCRVAYYNALGDYRRHVDTHIAPLLPDDAAIRAALVPREIDILYRSLGIRGRDPVPLTVLAYMHGISRQRVEQIRNAVFARLGLSLACLDTETARAFGQAAGEVNVIPERRRRRPRVLTVVQSTAA